MCFSRVLATISQVPHLEALNKEPPQASGQLFDDSEAVHVRNAGRKVGMEADYCASGASHKCRRHPQSSDYEIQCVQPLAFGARESLIHLLTCVAEKKAGHWVRTSHGYGNVMLWQSYHA